MRRSRDPDRPRCTPGLRFDAPQRAITPGQAVVFYDGPEVVGGAAGSLAPVVPLAASALRVEKPLGVERGHAPGFRPPAIACRYT